MEQIKENMQKYANYRTQMERLKKALAQQFYLEAIFIEYAILEDRLESILRHSGSWNPKPETFYSLDFKRKRVAKMAEEKKSLAQKYFPADLTDRVDQWTKERNRMIHALLKISLHTQELAQIAFEGEAIAKLLSNKTTLYARALERAVRKRER